MREAWSPIILQINEVGNSQIKNTLLCIVDDVARFLVESLLKVITTTKMKVMLKYLLFIPVVSSSCHKSFIKS